VIKIDYCTAGGEKVHDDQIVIRETGNPTVGLAAPQWRYDIA
jgi:hypothetical protein